MKTHNTSAFIRIRRKNMGKWVSGMLTLVLVMITMNGCSMKNTTVGTNTEGEKASVTPSSAEGEKLSETPTPSEAEEEPEEDRFSLYSSLLMKHLDEIDRILGETSEKTEEEAFDYKKANIRVWIDRGDASQIWTTDKTIDFNGAHIGDAIEKFIEVFGEPSQDVNGEAHFGYEGYFLVVQYDTSTKEAVRVYLLSEDYGYEEDSRAE